MNIFRRELKANLRSLIIWGVIVILFVTVGFSKFSAYEGNPELLAVLDSMPPVLLSMLNMEAFNLTTLTGFFGGMFAYFALILSIAAAMWGSDIISKEERDKTVEFSLTLPVKRSTLITAKTMAALVNCIALLVITAAATLVNSTAYQTDSEFYNFFSLSMVALFIMQLIFLAVGIFLGCAMKRHKRAGTVAVSVLLLTYFFSILSTLNENLAFLKYLSPFMYFNPAKLLHDATIDPTFLVISAGIIAACLIGAYYTYARRDLYI
ncbi:MAG: ABC transporter permease subunit [Candidatus Promineifilaceae bacterium]